MKNATNNNREYIARLMAVQACYQTIHNKKPVQILIEEYLEDGLKTNEEEDIEIKIQPHGGLFKKILLNLKERRPEIEEIVKAHTKSTNDVEPLLQAILLCGACELLQHIETDAPIIVNDYLNVTHEFFPKAQASFVNGILDSVSKSLRENA